MYKALIVDDEPIIRSGLRQVIDWGAWGYEICGEAGDGPGAVKAIRELRPDLTLLDIRLPGFSGIDVMRETAAQGLATRFIILSGYAEFEYAQKAILLGAKGYILKPVEEETLIERIRFVAKEIEAEQEEFRRLRQARLLRIIAGEDAGPGWFTGNWAQAASLSGNSALLAEEAAHFFAPLSCTVSPYRDSVLVIFEDVPEEAVKRFLERFPDHSVRLSLRNMRLKGGDSAGKTPPAITLGGRYAQNNGEGIRCSVREALELLPRIFFYRSKKYISADMLAKTASHPALPLPDSSAKDLCAYIQAIDNDKITAFFEVFQERCVQSGKSAKDIRQECITVILEIRNTLLRKHSGIRDMLGSGKEILDAIMGKRYLADITDNMAEECRCMSGYLTLLSADSLFQRVVSYVLHNYTEDLKLEALGKLFNYNSAYLGKRFKEHTGESFHTYLDILRIDAAKDMLINTNMKVYEISGAVGYANTDYFYSKFKKYTGQSPLDFRRKP
ncbi:MAG: response regulator transcription factor [Treponema sp.]|jgi:two-component system response regulator YesN|nr:response regulator transcription factor [Treponema sp.]